jgi:hypothetical protein
MSRLFLKVFYNLFTSMLYTSTLYFAKASRPAARGLRVATVSASAFALVGEEVTTKPPCPQTNVLFLLLFFASFFSWLFVN